jgi:RNA polymerase sigma-70 factor, ECF subfamily
LVGRPKNPYHEGKSADFTATGEYLPEGHAAVPQHSPPPDQGAQAAEDQKLVQACLAGMPGAWETFLERFSGLFVFVVDRMAERRRTPLPAADREDLVAEIVLECLRDKASALQRFAGRSSLATYLVVIARRVAVRRLVRDVGAFRLNVDGEPIEREASAADLPERIEDREQVASLLGQLDPDEAKLVRLHHLEGRSYGEISRYTGLPLGSIGPALSRARTKLRTLVEASRTG